MKMAVLTLGLYKGSGGVNKCMRAFQQVFDPEIISWVNQDEMAASSLIWDRTTIVRGTKQPILKGLLYPGRGETEKAEAIISKTDLVACHSFWRWHNLWLYKIAQKHGIPYWFIPHGGLDPYVFETDSVAKRLFLALGGARFIRRASCVIFSTQREREKAVRICNPSRTKVVYWPLDESDFDIARNLATGQMVRARLGIGEKARCLLYFGRLHPMKRPLETIEAVAASRIPNLHLLMVGNEFGVTIEDCRRQAAQYGIGTRVHVVGPAYGQDVIDYISASDAYISLSHRENFNFTAAECMAAALPVILSPGNDLVGELGAIDCGWLLKESNTAAVTSIMQSMFQCSAAVLQEKGANARQWACRELRFDTFQKRLSELAVNEA